MPGVGLGRMGVPSCAGVRGDAYLARIRDISAVVGLTERTVQAIVADLEAAGYLTRTRAGRRTRYTINRDSLFRHRAQEGLRAGP
jgi:DNA-binding transcriptional regulator PaaX